MNQTSNNCTSIFLGGHCDEGESPASSIFLLNNLKCNKKLRKKNHLDRIIEPNKSK
uniref:Uncharacterized protein n=1 Tax=Nelumbo nucifera TaxID=4432 RepID=A0A822XG51_NELNU|nr:TPA_asm: hypothetical protein HUJ06_019268 [Nelumbo nucifera]